LQCSKAEGNNITAANDKESQNSSNHPSALDIASSGGDSSHSKQKEEEQKQECIVAAQHQQHHVTVQQFMTVTIGNDMSKTIGTKSTLAAWWQSAVSGDIDSCVN